MFTASGTQDMPEPRALTEEGIADTVRDFRRAAAAAVAAGADGVEIHAANGYLLQQFLSTNANRRADRYGGSVENRIRLTVEVAEAVADEIGAGRTGIRVSPAGTVNDVAEDDTPELYGALVEALAPLDLAFLHVAYMRALDEADEALLRSMHRGWPGALVLNRSGADLETRARDIEDGTADAVSVGALALANPDLVERVKTGAPLNEPDKSTSYSGDERGYTDYPTLSEADRANARVA